MNLRSLWPCAVLTPISLISVRGLLLATAVLSLGSSARPHPLPGGHVVETEIRASGYAPRRVWIYTPPRWSPAVVSRLLIAFDGEEYVHVIPKALDELIDEGKIPSTVAVLIDNGSGRERLMDLANRARFAEFVGKHVVDWARTHYAADPDPRHVAAFGSSAGGLAAAYAAFTFPERIGVAVSFSGAFWRGDEASNAPPWEWLTTAFAGAPRHSTRFILEVGDRETQGALGGSAPSILDANRHLRDVLARKGYEVDYAEIKGGGHGDEFWAPRVKGALARALGFNR